MSAPFSVYLGAPVTVGDVVLVQYETAADRERRRLALLQEASEWRRIAVEITTTQAGRFQFVCLWIDADSFRTSAREYGIIQVPEPLRARMLAKIRFETARTESFAFSFAEDDDCDWLRANFCLFCALECEDEAAALKPKRRRAS